MPPDGNHRPLPNSIEQRPRIIGMVEARSYSTGFDVEIAEYRRRLAEDPWAVNGELERLRLRERGRRPLAENLEEGLDLIESLSDLVGSANIDP